MKSISLSETKKAIAKILEIPSSEYAIAEISGEDGAIRVDFKFNMRHVISNTTFFKSVPQVMKDYSAYVSLEPKGPNHDGLYIELTVSMKVGEVKP